LIPAPDSLRNAAGILSVIASLVALALPGCGAEDGAGAPGDGAGAPVAARQLSKVQFLARINGSCRRAWPGIRRNIATYRSEQNSELTPRRFEEMVSRSLAPDIKIHIFDQIQVLGAPRGDAPEIRRIMRWLGEAIEIGEDRSYPITDPVVLWDLFDMFNPLSRRYGLRDCLVNKAHTGLGAGRRSVQRTRA
jgi:hypothetical protein